MLAGSLIHFVSAAKSFAGTEELVTRTSGASTALMMGVKSLGFHRNDAKAAGLIAIIDCVPIHNVWPSAGAFSTASALTLPLAPGLLSTMNVPPVSLVS